MYLFTLNALIVDGCLRVDWIFSERIYRRSTVDSLARDFVGCLRQLIEVCASAQEVRIAPAEFADFAWEQSDVQDMTAAIGKVLGKT